MCPRVAKQKNNQAVRGLETTIYIRIMWRKVRNSLLSVSDALAQSTQRRKTIGLETEWKKSGVV
jgi:hypothetical protein